MKNNIFTQLDQSLVQYFINNGVLEHDFYCKSCGTLLIDDINDLSLYRYIQCKNNKKIKHPYFEKNINGKYCKVSKEPIEYRWLLFGKYLTQNKITVFRKMCWDCFFDYLFKNFDVLSLARRKKKWWKRVADGVNEIPKAFISCSPYFKFLFDLTDEQLNLEQKKLVTASKESFILRHGEEKGLIYYNEYVKRQAYTCSKEYMINEKGMTEQQWIDFNKNRSSTKDNFIQRYGIEYGTKKWNEYCQHESYAGNKLQYFIDKYGEDVGLKKYEELNRKKAITEDNLIRKYGEEVGKAKYKNIIEKRDLGYSEISQLLFNMIDDSYYPSKIESRYASKNSEVKLYYNASNGIKSYYCLDYVLGNKVIEFYGDLWHANPKKYLSGQNIKYGKFTKNVDEIWKKDQIRIFNIEQHGFKVKIVWESDFSKDRLKVVNQCIDFLKT